MRFEHDIRLIIGLTVLIATVAFYRYRQRSKEAALKQLGDIDLVKKLFPNYSLKRENLKFAGLMTALALLFIAWANPQYGVTLNTGKQLSSDVMIALDVSNSMYATDIQPSRLERAKNFAIDLVHELRTERIGTIVFAGHAYLQMPLTSDYSAASLFLKAAERTLLWGRFQDVDLKPREYLQILFPLRLFESRFPLGTHHIERPEIIDRIQRPFQSHKV